MSREEPFLPVLHLHPGEIYVGGAPMLVHTVLGSCVAVTMFYRPLSFAAICHALLPSGEAYDDRGTNRYVDSAVAHLTRRYVRREIPLDELEVKLFGGGDVLEGTGRTAGPTVGSQNVAAARAVLHGTGLRVVAEDVLGTWARTLYFNTETGEVLLRRVAGGSLGDTGPAGKVPRVRRQSVAPRAGGF